ncbi:hypothetical protein [Clostridium sp. KNHs214]|uniref:hypothetical protein n=1 Tax=Clostridium sp. KNHs214 TaxID=1540257 RepID=UPI000A54172A|nr:hypothetical protein [Clostridium sp. KNHs214]
MDKNKLNNFDKIRKDEFKYSGSLTPEITNFTAAHINSGVTSADIKLAKKLNEEKKRED